jgi:hypothetical protein
VSGDRLRYHRIDLQTKGHAMMNLYNAIVGTDTDTNVGLARFMGVIIAFIVIGGTLFWALG